MSHPSLPPALYNAFDDIKLRLSVEDSRFDCSLDLKLYETESFAYLQLKTGPHYSGKRLILGSCLLFHSSDNKSGKFVCHLDIEGYSQQIIIVNLSRKCDIKYIDGSTFLLPPLS